MYDYEYEFDVLLGLNKFSSYVGQRFCKCPLSEPPRGCVAWGCYASRGGSFFGNNR